MIYTDQKELKVQYNPIYEEYLHYHQLFDQEIAMEEVGDERPQQTLLNRIAKYIEQIVNMLDTAVLKIRNFFQKVLLTDKSFQKELADARKNKEPLQGIKAIIYLYKDSQLNTIYDRLFRTFGSMLQQFTKDKLMDDSNPLGRTEQGLHTFLFQKMGLPSDVENVQDFFRYTKQSFRGEKTNQVISGQQVDNLFRVVNGYKPIQTKVNQNMTTLKNQINTIRGQINTIANDASITAEIKRKAVSQLRDISELYTLFCSFSSLFFELKVEEMLQSRALLRRFYLLS